MPNLGITSIKAKKASAKWRIKHKVTQTLQPANENSLAVNYTKTHWVVKKTTKLVHQNQFDEYKTTQGAVGDFIIHNWEGQFV